MLEPQGVAQELVNSWAVPRQLRIPCGPLATPDFNCYTFNPDMCIPEEVKWAQMTEVVFWGCKSLRPEKVLPIVYLPKFWAKFRWTFWAEFLLKPFILWIKARIVKKILGKASDDSLLLKDFVGLPKVRSHSGTLALKAENPFLSLVVVESAVTKIHQTNWKYKSALQNLGIKWSMHLQQE